MILIVYISVTRGCLFADLLWYNEVTEVDIVQKPKCSYDLQQPC